MTGHQLLITGGTGFVGSHVVDRLLAACDATGGPPPRLLTHRREAPESWHRAGEVAVGNLADPGSLKGICDGVDTVVHLAARIGGDEEQCRAINTEGTRALLEEAARSGVRRFVQLGTAAVYKDVPHRGEAEGRLAVGPTSPTSITRLAGEQLVLAAGGTVLRPHLIFGNGDTWVMAAVVDLMRRVPHWVDGGRARISMVSVDVLAAAIADLALRADLPAGQVLHASHPEPVRVRDLVTTVARELRLPLPEGDLTMAEALDLLDAAEAPVWKRRLSLLAVDHWYDSTRLWDLVVPSPGPRFTEAFPAYTPWYRATLR